MYHKVIHCASSHALHAYHGLDVHSYCLQCHGRSKDSDLKHRNFREKAGTSTSSTMRVECIIFYVGLRACLIFLARNTFAFQ